METTFLARIRDHLFQKQTVLGDWLRTTPADKQTLLLYPAGPAAVQAHLGTIEHTLERTEAGTFGICQVCGDPVEAELLEVDYTACVCLEDLSSEQKTRLQDELELARSVQKALLPESAPGIPGLDIAAYSRPAEFLGGDYFDFIDFSADRHGLVIADVAGHGVSASLQMASLQALARAVIPASQSPAQAVQHLHGLFQHNIRFTTFVTLFLGAYSPATRILHYVNAGHNPPLVLRSDRGPGVPLSRLGPTGPAIGLVDEVDYGERAVSLQPGDLLVLYTDGVVEAADAHDEFYGTDRLAEAVERSGHAPAREVLRDIRQSLEAFIADRPLADDTTLVVCRVT